MNMKGKNTQTINKKCKDINQKINLCVIEIPPQYNDILHSFKQTIEHVENFMESNMPDNAKLKEARDYLNNAIKKMKQEDKNSKIRQ